jgi:hypothetical protein
MKIKPQWMFIFLLLYIMGGYTLMGCTNIRNKSPEKKIYRIQAHSQMAASNTPETGEGLLVKRFSISPEFETLSFVYRLSPTRFANDFYNNFIAAPARMITDVIQEDLWASPLFSPAYTLTQARFQLEGKVTEFYGDIQDTQQPMAVVTLRLLLEETTDNGVIPVIHKTYGAKILMTSPDPGIPKVPCQH